GKLYRWDLSTNTFTQSIVLTAGIGEAYTPTIIGVDGTVYAINNATLFAVRRSRFDVSADGHVSAFDALLIINFLNASDPREQPLKAPPGNPFYDVTADTFVAPNDALDVINQINAFPESEGEPGTAAADAPAAVAENLEADFLFTLLATDFGRQSRRPRG